MSIIFKGKDGSVAVMTLAPGADKEEAIRKFQEAHEGFYTDHFEYEGEYPSRALRDAWTIRNNKVVIDENKAKQIVSAQLRAERNKELDELDKEQLRNLAFPDKLQEIEKKKQILRQMSF